MAVITFSGAPGCRVDEMARIAAQHLQFEFLNDARLSAMLDEEFGPEIPDRAYPHAIASLVTRLAMEHHLVLSTPDAELVVADFPASLCVNVVAPEASRVGVIMIDRGLDRAAARKLLGEMDRDQRAARKRRFGRVHPTPERFGLFVNAATFDAQQIAAVVEQAVSALGLKELGLLPAGAEAQRQFQIRLKLSRHGIVPAGKVALKKTQFGHPSEEIFATLLDFYRIAWEYEPHSFPIQWDKGGRVLEAFTPDFYLPELDLYVELTTMKQAHVTRKNRKVKLLRQMYPHVNIQVFYQKDIQNLIFKHGLAERAPQPQP
ncbi:MAG: cytidylate kinase family protein [Acidobacteria bacterium]|nr:cytidylate kinase family protein [Acidobacteriota bacterium]MBI3281131.1 cytidylate kinase family protein [Acidobacteriota bacterium]